MIDINPDGDKIIRLSVAMTILAGIAVFLRLLARPRTGASYAADDGWIAASLALFYAYMGLQIWSKQHHRIIFELMTSLTLCCRRGLGRSRT